MKQKYIQISYDVIFIVLFLFFLIRIQKCIAIYSKSAINITKHNHSDEFPHSIFKISIFSF